MKLRKYCDNDFVIMIDTKTNSNFDLWKDFNGVEMEEIGIVDLNNNIIFKGDVIKFDDNYYIVENDIKTISYIMRNILDPDETIRIKRKNNYYEVVGNIFQPHFISAPDVIKNTIIERFKNEESKSK